ncbi:MAG: preprotein translocase subunit YajC [Spirochaetaceae bacterium]|nr:preprotein translocase subunit YajC [Spirochaetaceae bacterium]MBO7484554.1 preprotein translocase subunit YajC [Spirochaetaceae bacterium]
MPLTSAAQTATGLGSLVSMLPLLLVFVIFYFLLIRPQSKKQKETEKMIAALKKGDKIVTIGGIHGVISSTKENTVIVKVDDNTKIEFSRSAIASLVTEKTEKEETSKKGKDKAVEEKTDTDKSEEK